MLSSVSHINLNCDICEKMFGIAGTIVSISNYKGAETLMIFLKKLVQLCKLKTTKRIGMFYCS